MTKLGGSEPQFPRASPVVAIPRSFSTKGESSNPLDLLVLLPSSLDFCLLITSPLPYLASPATSDRTLARAFTAKTSRQQLRTENTDPVHPFLSTTLELSPNSTQPSHHNERYFPHNFTYPNRHSRRRRYVYQFRHRREHAALGRLLGRARRR
jgi:hypothetical protein